MMDSHSSNPLHSYSEKEFKRYFPRPSIAGLIIAGIGVLLSLCSLPGDFVSEAAIGPYGFATYTPSHFSPSGLAIFSLLMIIAGIVISFYPYFGSRPTDAGFDAWVAQHIERQKSQMIERLGMEQQQFRDSPPFVVHGVVVPNTPEAKERFKPGEVRSKMGNDGVRRFSINEITLFFVGEHHISAFTSTVSAMNLTDHSETVREYFCQDVVGATADDIGGKIERKWFQFFLPRTYRVQRFAVKVANGEEIGVTIGEASAKQVPGINRDLDETRRRLLFYIRQKKLV